MKRISLTNVFRGRQVNFKAKGKRVFNVDDEEEKAEYKFWTKTYGFIRDITANLGGDYNEDDSTT